MCPTSGHSEYYPFQEHVHVPSHIKIFLNSNTKIKKYKNKIKTEKKKEGRKINTQVQSKDIENIFLSSDM